MSNVFILSYVQAFGFCNTWVSNFVGGIPISGVPFATYGSGLAQLKLFSPENV